MIICTINTTVYGDYKFEHQYLHFKVYTGGKVFTYYPDPALDWEDGYAVYDQMVGTSSNPYIIDITPVSLANDADNTATLTTFDTQTCDMALTGRTLFKDGSWNTLCLPFSLSAAQIAADPDFADATVMELDTDDKNGFDPEDGTLYLWFKTATAIEAGVPYLVKWEKAADYEGNEANYDISNPVFVGVTVNNTAAQAVESTTTGLETVLMVGTYSPVSVTADDKSILFMGNANTLYYSSIDRHIRSFRAYFSVPYIMEHAAASVRAFALSFDGNQTTQVTEAPTAHGAAERHTWHTLHGIPLSGKPTAPGLYVSKGRKYVVK